MRSLLELDVPPQAIFAANVTLALGAMSAAYAAGVRIPDELSMISIHDLDLAEYASPPLSVIRMPIYEMGQLAVQLLSSTPPDEPIQRVVEAPLELIARQSTSSPRG
jgi:LacI family transcriptional regulator